MTAVAGRPVRALPRLRGLVVGMPRLTRRGWFVFAAGAVGVIVGMAAGWRDLLYAGCVLVALVAVGSLAIRARSSSLAVTRRNNPEVVPVGEATTVELDVVNTAWLRSGPQTWRDLVPRGFASPPPALLGSLASRGDPGSTARVGYALAPTERGIAAIGPMLVERTDPFGLAVHERLVGTTAPLTVLPRITELDGGVPGRSSIADTIAPAWKTGHGADDVIAREYRSGDALRHVHWRATAHRGELMVRQEQSQDEARAVVLLDTRRESYATAAAFEWAVEYAASLLAHLGRSGVGAQLMETRPASGADGPSPSSREALLSLATVDRRSAMRAGGASYLTRLADLLGPSPGPVWAVLGDAPDGELRELAALKARAGGASIVLVGDPDRRPPDELWFAGWQCAVGSAGADVAEVWRSAAGRSLR
ncbi:MAG: conserved rane protein [Naasia sp.]|nr:conserved rane protein [Naasia sp.]